MVIANSLSEHNSKALVTWLVTSNGLFEQSSLERSDASARIANANVYSFGFRTSTRPFAGDATGKGETINHTLSACARPNALNPL